MSVVDHDGAKWYRKWVVGRLRCDGCLTVKVCASRGGAVKQAIFSATADVWVLTSRARFVVYGNKFSK
jgi:hypothetical protein